jgi:hypothetical protein
MQNEKLISPATTLSSRPRGMSDIQLIRIVGAPAYRGWLNGALNATTTTCLDWYESHETCPLGPSDTSPSQLGYNSGGKQWKQLFGFGHVFGFLRSS